ncbi:MAG: phytanoyl-CoA dioxygenase family protein [Gammaproteobacteria bacterium]|nr:phytanoyl-CoA dioxygenase family protein [Gammaproteobacteria bacterium]
MIADEILKVPPRVLPQSDRQRYFSTGYLCVQNVIPADQLEELRAVTNAFTERSRSVSQSDDIFDLAPEHSAEKPVVRRLKSPDIQHDAYWRLATGILADVAADLVGPDVVFHHSKLNFKWCDESDEVHWHQDAQFFPHTNYNVLTIGAYLTDTGPDDGPLAVIPRSHEGPLYDQYDTNDTWVGHLKADDVESLDLESMSILTGSAGSITIHSCRTVHGSPASRSPTPRPLLLNCYTSADARPYTPHPQPTRNAYSIVRGKPARWAHHDPRPCLIPPDWSGGYTSIYAAQARESG